jgi:hypothetical protein
MEDLIIEIVARKIILLSEYRFMIRNPGVMDDLHGCRKFPEATGSRRDDDREPHGRVYAFSDHKAVLADE